MFKDRTEAAELLADYILDFNWRDPVVIALPRGGVPVGEVIARKLKAPLDLVVPRKIGNPKNPEYAQGAITETGDFILNPDHPEIFSEPWFEEVIKKEQEEAQRRMALYLGGRKRIPLKNRQVILVDDGMATGLTMRAAIQSIRHQKPRSITVAVPVAPPEVVADIGRQADHVICIKRPKIFMAVGAHYQDFPQITDDQVISIMKTKKNRL